MADSSDSPPKRGDEVSPAREALQATLRKKKKSGFFDNVRALGQRSVLSVKAGLDSIRGETSIPEAVAKDPLEINLPYTDAGNRRSTEEAGNATPVPSAKGRSHTFSPKNAVSTWRLRTHASKKKRGSLNHITYTSEGEVLGAAGPERFSADFSDVAHENEASDAAHTHNRRASVASTLVGSLKGLSYMVNLKRPATPEGQYPSEEVEQEMPQPSAPIDIPSSAPALNLDFGSSGLMMSDMFGRSPEKEPSNSVLKLTDPDNITSGVPMSRRMHIPENFSRRSRVDECNHRPEALQHNLHVPEAPPAHSPPQSPSTPMPGTNMPLEVDGALETDTNVFERSVEAPASLELESARAPRRMSSLDAITEAVTTLSSHIESVIESPEVNIVDPVDVAPRACNLDHGTSDRPATAASRAESGAVRTTTTTSDSSTHLTPDCASIDDSSVSTLSLCPADMSELYRVTSPIAPVSGTESQSDLSPLAGTVGMSSPVGRPLAQSLQRTDQGSVQSLHSSESDDIQMRQGRRVKLVQDTGSSDYARLARSSYKNLQRTISPNAGYESDCESIATAGPPSPTRTVRLPLRPKVTAPAADMTVDEPPSQESAAHWLDLRMRTVLAAEAIANGAAFPKPGEVKDRHIRPLASVRKLEDNRTKPVGDLQSSSSDLLQQSSVAGHVAASPVRLVLGSGTDGAKLVEDERVCEDNVPVDNPTANNDEELTEAERQVVVSDANPHEPDQPDTAQPCNYNLNDGELPPTPEHDQQPAVVRGSASPESPSGPTYSRPGFARSMNEQMSFLRRGTLASTQDMNTVSTKRMPPCLVELMHQPKLAQGSANDYDKASTQEVSDNTGDLSKPEHSGKYDYTGSPYPVPLVPRPIHHDHDHAEILASESTSSHGDMVLSPTAVDKMFSNNDIKCWLGAENHENAGPSRPQFPTVSIDDSADAPLMGSPTDFALRQSERNMRYNSLQQDTAEQSPSPCKMQRTEQPTVLFSPTLPCKDPRSNRFSVLALDYSPGTSDSQILSPDTDTPAKQAGDSDREVTPIAAVKASPARYRKRRVYRVVSSPSSDEM